MKLTKKELKIKYSFYCLIIAAFALLQNVGGLWFEIGGARCFFLIPAAILLSLGEDEKIAALLGLFAGILWDCVSAAHMVFNAIVLMLLCYVGSALVNFVFRNTARVGMAITTVGAFLYCVLYWLLIVLPRGTAGAGFSLLNFYLPSFLYTAFIGLLLALLLAPVKKKLNRGIAE